LETGQIDLIKQKNVISMNKTLNNVGLLAILPLFTVALTTDYFDEANAMPNVGNDVITKFQ